MERRKAFDIENGFYAIIPAFINRGAQIGNFIRKIKKKIVLHPFTYETINHHVVSQETKENLYCI